MGYIDLMLLRTPGMNVARLSGQALRSLDDVAQDLPALERAGKGLPEDPFLGTPELRQHARYQFANVARRFDDAESSASRFGRGSAYGDTTTSFSTVISDAESARSGAIHLERRYDRLPAGIHHDVADAVRDADEAVRVLDRARYSPSESVQRHAARDAAHDLDDGRRSMRDASFHLNRELRPFQRYDELRLGAEDGLEHAVGRAAKAADVRGVGADTKSAAEAALVQTREAQGALAAVGPGEPTGGVAAQIHDTKVALSAARDSARTEPTPANFKFKVAAAYTGTAAVLGGAGYGTYRLTQA